MLLYEGDGARYLVGRWANPTADGDGLPARDRSSPRLRFSDFAGHVGDDNSDDDDEEEVEEEDSDGDGDTCDREALLMMRRSDFSATFLPGRLGE